MDIPMGLCKPDRAGKSTRSFNGETGSEATRSQSPGFHAAGKTP
jgi:hypothetical protein